MTSEQLPEDKQLNPSVLMFNTKRYHTFDLPQKRERFCDVKLTGNETPAERKLIAEKEIARIKSVAESNKIKANNFTQTIQHRGLIMRLKYIELY